MLLVLFLNDCCVSLCRQFDVRALDDKWHIVRTQCVVRPGSSSQEKIDNLDVPITWDRPNGKLCVQDELLTIFARRLSRGDLQFLVRSHRRKGDLEVGSFGKRIVQGHVESETASRVDAGHIGLHLHRGVRVVLAKDCRWREGKQRKTKHNGDAFAVGQDATPGRSTRRDQNAEGGGKIPPACHQRVFV
jgi:hypothetical protein